MSPHLPTQLHGMFGQKLASLQALPLVFLLVLFLFFPSSVGCASPKTPDKAQASSQPTRMVQTLPLQTFRWEKRLVLLFAPTSPHTTFQKQLALFQNQRKGLKERHILLIQVIGQGQSKVGKRLIAKNVAKSYLQQLKLSKKSYSFVLIGKDGGVKLRRNKLVSTKELFGLIDSMPMRQDEMKQQAKKGPETL